MIRNLKKELPPSNIPLNHSRIEVLFESPKLWFRGSYFISQGGKHYINYDDGTKCFITTWEDVKWRYAKYKCQRKTGMDK
jgi:hypothetical protein